MRLFGSRISTALVSGAGRQLSIVPSMWSTSTNVSRNPPTPGGPSTEELADTTSTPPVDPLGVASLKSSTDSINKAMKSYLERAAAHQKFMSEQEEEFVFGRRHLANMMGKDPETFTQNDIDEAIRYLFPHSLFHPMARPIMRPPQEIYPKAKAAQFDATGRPHHPFFYTARPNFFYLIHEAVNKMNALNELGSNPASTDSVELTGGTIWISKEELESKLMEPLKEGLYEEWVTCMDRLAEHPNAEKEKEFIQSYRKPLGGQNVRQEFPPVLLEEDGSQSVKVELCTKKKAVGTVVVKMPGTGKIEINGKGLDYFPLMRAREAFIYPLQLVDWLGTVDVWAETAGSGVMAQAASLRWGVATGIAALGADAEVLRLAGLLTRDRRRKERRHMGCEGARARWTWKKR